MKWRGLLLVALLLSQVGTAFSDNTSVSVSVVTPECNDGVDNDSDSLLDYPADTGCSSSLDNDETDPVIAYECNDGVDNDSDGRIDYPTDLGCDSATDDSEAGEITPGTVTGGVNSGGTGPVVGQADATGQVIFEGLAVAGDSLQVLVDGFRHPGIVVGGDGYFSLLVQGLSGGTHIFILYVMNLGGEVARPQSFALDVSEGLITYVSDINFVRAEARQPRGGCTNGNCKGDLNTDRKIDLIDFSIASYWWQRPLEGDFVGVEKKELNGDGKVNIEDFSILAYYWTG